MAFDGGLLSSDGSWLPLREVERKMGLPRRLAACLPDRRATEKVRHAVTDMIRFHILAIAADSRDATDCDSLRTDRSFKMTAPRPRPYREKHTRAFAGTALMN